MKAKRGLIFEIVLFGIFLCFISLNFVSAFSGTGDGSLGNPYIITNCTQLDETRDDLTANYSLGNNINMSAVGCEAFQTGAGFLPIGNCTLNASDCLIQYIFSGNFEGNNYNISNLYINYPERQYIGLFGVTRGNISNVNLVNVNITGNSSVGALVGYVYYDLVYYISNVHSSGSVTSVGSPWGAGGIAGGLIGLLQNSILDSSSSSVEVRAEVPDVDWSSHAGGLVGESYNGIINNSYATGNVYGASDTVGGLVGETSGIIESSYATGNVTGYYGIGGLAGFAGGNVLNCNSSGFVNSSNQIGSGYSGSGGLIGYLSGSVINNSFAIGEVYATGEYVGALVGYVDDGNVSSSYATGNAITGGSYAGGLVGYVSEGNILSSYATGNVEGDDYVGGLVGENDGNIYSSYSTGNATGYYAIGGFVGLSTGNISNSNSTGSPILAGDNGESIGGFVGENADQGIINASYSTGDVITTDSGVDIGGFVGLVQNEASIINSYATGNVSVNGYYVGGLVGFSYGILNNSYATGNVDATGSYVGGLVGYAASNVENCYATGDVNAGQIDSNSYAGGLIGSCASQGTATVSKSYATGNVNATGFSVGGFAGYCDSSIDNSYATGNVITGGSYAGGFVGSSASTISNSYSAGDVTGYLGAVSSFVGDFAGGSVSNSFSTGNLTIIEPVSDNGKFIGIMSNDAFIENSYWLNNSEFTSCWVSGGEFGDENCTAIDTLEYFFDYDNPPMNLSTEDGWDFTDIWDDVYNGTDYPVLQWQNANVPVSCGDTITSNLTLTEDLDCSGYDGNVLTIGADNITIDCEGYDISSDSYNFLSKAIVNTQYDGITIQNCNFINWTVGIYIYPDGEEIKNNFIINNTFVKNDFGIKMQSLSNNNFIRDNYFLENTNSGLYIYEGGNNTIYRNNFNNTAYGVKLDYSEYNNVSYNSFDSNNYGLFLDYNSDYNSILYNNFTDNDYGFYLNYADNNQIGYNFINSSNYNFGDSSSCPFLYTWNGTSYTFVSDMSTEGKLSLKQLYPDDYLKVEGSQLQPQDGKYNLQVTEEYDEISFIDQLKLFTIDHSPEVDVFNGLTRADAHKIFTVSKNPAPIVSCVDVLGNNCLSEVSAKDGIFTMRPVNNITNQVVLNLGNLSNASEIKLIVSYSWVNGYLVPNYKKSVQVLDENGNWVSILSDSDLTTRAALQKTYVLNLTNKFLTNNYSVRLVLPIQAIDYVAVDTTPEQEVSIKEYDPLTADLHYRGYSNFVTNITRTFFYDDLINQSFSTPSGNFTKYGDVLSLVNSTDDIYAIFGHGDEISVSFEYEPVAEGLERDFLMFEYAYYKPASLDIGKAVGPLPFRAMSKYPYNESESYPVDEEHQNYLSEYNTRKIVSQRFGGSLPYGFNNSVFENTIIVDSEGYGLYLYEEQDTSLLDNTISGEGYGIYLSTSVRTIIQGNNVSGSLNNSLYLENSDSNEITDNIFNSSIGSVLFINDASNHNNIIHNKIIGDVWVTDYNGDNYYNDSYSGNIYYLTNGTPSWEVYDIIDDNADGWADSGTGLPFNASLSGNTVPRNVSEIVAGEPDSYAYMGVLWGIGGWENNEAVYDGNWSTGSSPSEEFDYYASLHVNYFLSGIHSEVNLTVVTGTGTVVIDNLPEDCLSSGTWDEGRGQIIGVLVRSNFTAQTLNISCMKFGEDSLISLRVIEGESQLNDTMLSVLAEQVPWAEGGSDWYPATTDSPSIRSVNVSLVSPEDNSNSASPVSFIYNASIGWQEQDISFCNLTAINQRTEEISPDESLIGLWNFEGNLDDSSGNGNDGTVYGTENFSSDSKIGDFSYYFDGDSAIRLPEDSLFTSIDNFSIATWIKLTEYNGYSSITAFGNGGDDFLFYTNEGGKVCFYDFSACGESELSLNQWYHIAVTRASDTVSFYVNGEFDGSTTVSTDPIEPYYGMRNIGGDEVGETVTGFLDELAIWNRSLTTEEIADLYNEYYENSSSSITMDTNQTLSLNLLEGNYTWSVSCTDDAGVVGISETRILIVNGTVSAGETLEEDVPESSSTSGGYAPKTYNTDEQFPTEHGNNFNLRFNDKIRFVVNLTNHTLTLDQFNSSTAKVLIQSEPITAYLQKGIMQEFDVNGDGKNDVRVRYDGLNNTKAMMFIQEMVYHLNNSGGNRQAINNSLGVQSKDYNYLVIAGVIVISVIIIILAFVLHKKHKKRRYYHKGY
jgi:parallel beta-helix repeat protein